MSALLRNSMPICVAWSIKSKNGISRWCWERTDPAGLPPAQPCSPMLSGAAALCYCPRLPFSAVYKAEKNRKFLSKCYRHTFLTCSWYASVLLWPLVWIKHRPVWGARELCEEGIWIGSGGWNCWMVTLFMLPSYCCSRLRCCRLCDPIKVWIWLPACG